MLCQHYHIHKVQRSVLEETRQYRNEDGRERRQSYLVSDKLSRTLNTNIPKRWRKNTMTKPFSKRKRQILISEFFKKTQSCKHWYDDNIELNCRRECNQITVSCIIFFLIFSFYVSSAEMRLTITKLNLLRVLYSPLLVGLVQTTPLYGQILKIPTHWTTKLFYRQTSILMNHSLVCVNYFLCFSE